MYTLTCGYVDRNVDKKKDRYLNLSTGGNMIKFIRVF